MTPVLNTIVIYARNMRKTAEFYCRLFDFQSSLTVMEGLIALEAKHGGASILVLQAAKSVKLGQVGVKLSFAVRDVEAFKAMALKRGVKFGATHSADGYSFANVKDPDKNSVSVSSRSYRSPDACDA